MKPMRILAGGAVLAAFSLVAGCAGHRHDLVSDPGGEAIAGQLIHGHPAQRDRLIVIRAGRRYAGEFRAERVRDWGALQERFRGDPRKWERIVSGLDRSNEFSTAHVDLRAADGSSLVCELVWPTRDKPAGACSDAAGEVLSLQFD